MTAAEKQYGAALYQLAQEEGCTEEARAGLELTAGLLAEEPAYVKLLQNPAIPKAQRLTLLDEAFREAVHPYVLNFLKLLCEKSALGLLSGCKAALQEKLAQTTGKTILLEERVDESLLGGMKVEYAGKELDGSVAGRMERLRRILMDESV